MLKNPFGRVRVKSQTRVMKAPSPTFNRVALRKSHLRRVYHFSPPHKLPPIFLTLRIAVAYTNKFAISR